MQINTLPADCSIWATKVLGKNEMNHSSQLVFEWTAPIELIITFQD